MDENARQRRFRSQFLSGRNPEEQEAAILGFLSLTREGFVNFIEDLITVSRRRWNDAANVYRLQVWMLQTMLPIRTRVRQLANTPEGDGRDAHTNDLRELHALRTIIKAIRTVGDGIVWRLLGHDRATYRILAFGSSPGHMGEVGLEQELISLAGQVGREQGVPVLCSLTNVVRFGDIVVVSEADDGDEQITLVEVKTKKGKNPRVRRQRRKLKEIVTLLDERRGAIGKTEFQIQQRNVSQESYLPAVLNLIQHAAKTGSAGRRFGDHLHVECHVLRSVDNDMMRRVRDESLRMVHDWEARGDVVIELTNWDPTGVSPNVAPYSVFPFPDRTCAEILTNHILLGSFLNISGFLREFEKSGWSVDEGPIDAVDDAIRAGEDPRSAHLGRISKGCCTLALPSSFGTRVALEFAKPSMFVREANCDYAQGPESIGGVLAYYPDEKRIWR